MKNYINLVWLYSQNINKTFYLFFKLIFLLIIYYFGLSFNGHWDEKIFKFKTKEYTIIIPTFF
jgi:hypothetical protein